MSYKKIIIALLFTSYFFSCTPKINKPITPNIIPIPNQTVVDKGIFVMDTNTQLVFDQEFEQVASFFKAYIENGSAIKLQDKTAKNSISFIKDESITNSEGYILKITPTAITISANSPKGAFYGFQSLRQLIPTGFENDSYKKSQVAIQCLSITDAPRFAYRGMHLDVGRHFFPVSFVKKYIDLMSMLKMNTFHWHLTEDQGWRIEIKKYPKLQTVAAYRKETLVGNYGAKVPVYDGKRYGGFYTQEEIKDVVKYASARQVTIIPEIEIPGHAQAAIAAYPELGCTGKPVEVATTWGVFDDIYCPNENTFKFLEDVLDEVIPLFPGKYIHIGGDEAPKVRWKACKHCQALIKKLHLKDEHGLQSYFITRMEKYINSKGKQIIGWDEILEGGLAPNATVMSWRGTAGAVEAAQQHHNVVLTPGSHCYFDHYQSTNENEPIAIGGYLPLDKVYSFNPIPDGLTKEQEKYVLGAQGNVWTEYMETPEKVEYMAFPREVALSEVLWMNPTQKSYDDFVSRLEIYLKRLDAKNVNYANHLYEMSGTMENNNGAMIYHIKASSKNLEIHYTLDGQDPTPTSTTYKDGISITKSCTIKAAIFNKENKQVGTTFVQKIDYNMAVGKSITLSVPASPSYNAGGKDALINGIAGSDKRYGDKEWLGFAGDDLTVTIDLGKVMPIKSVHTRFFNERGSWIYAPKEVSLSFSDSKEIVSKKFDDPAGSIINVDLDANTSTRYITLKITNFGVIPDGSAGAGNRAWLFVDEIKVE